MNWEKMLSGEDSKHIGGYHWREIEAYVKEAHIGYYLEVIQNERLVWITAVITLAPHGKGTKYTALAMHKDEAGCRQHNEMGFHEGWGKALDQLVDLARRMPAQ